MLDRRIVRKLLRSAFKEDIGFGDITTTAVLTGEETGAASALAKSEIVVAGIDVFREAFFYIDRQIQFTGGSVDGQSAVKGAILAGVSGSLSSILIAERVALNFFSENVRNCDADKAVCGSGQRNACKDP